MPNTEYEQIAKLAAGRAWQMQTAYANAYGTLQELMPEANPDLLERLAVEAARQVCESLPLGDARRRLTSPVLSKPSSARSEQYTIKT